MPCVIIGGVKINSVASGSNVQLGDAGVIYLTSSCKIITGNNSLSPGDSYGSNQNIAGNVNTLDSDLVDTPNTTV